MPCVSDENEQRANHACALMRARRQDARTVRLRLRLGAASRGRAGRFKLNHFINFHHAAMLMHITLTDAFNGPEVR